MRSSILRWAAPLVCSVLCYGLAAGVWKHSSLTAGQFCILFVAAKAVTNVGAWLLRSRRSPFEPTARRFMGWALFGQLLNGGAWIFYFTALESGPVAIVQTVTAAYTALTVILALIFLHERLVAVQAVGVLMAIAAAMLLGYTPGAAVATSGMGWFAASLLTLGFWGTCVAVFKHAYNQPGADDYRFFLANLLGMALTVLPYGLYVSHGTPWVSEGLGLGLAIVLLYCVGDLALFAAVGRGPASIVSPISGLYPIPTIIYAALVLHESLSGLQWLAVAMVLLAIVLIVPEADNPVLRLLRPRKAT